MSAEEQAVRDVVVGVVDEIVERKESDTLNPSISATIVTEEETKMESEDRTELESQKDYLEEQRRVIQLQMDEIRKGSEIDTQKTITLRTMFAKKRTIISDLKETLEKLNAIEYEEKCRTKAAEKSAKLAKDVDKVFKNKKDTIRTTTETEPQFNRNLRMVLNYKKSITEMRDDIFQLVSQDISSMTQHQKDEMELEIQSKAGTIKMFTKEYEKHHHDLMLSGSGEEIELLIETFQTVMQISNGVEARIKQEEENKKKQLALIKTESLEAVKIEKFSGIGDNKYLKYYIWYTEFSELVLSKEYSDSVKLKFLKNILKEMPMN